MPTISTKISPEVLAKYTVDRVNKAFLATPHIFYAMGL